MASLVGRVTLAGAGVSVRVASAVNNSCDTFIDVVVGKWIAVACTGD